MSLSGAGSLGPPRPSSSASDDGPVRHPWRPPVPDTSDPIAQGQLLLKNTLTGKKDVFVPAKDRHVRWYICGPTVYDSAHVGHARTYLSFDIMRRVFTDYFRYNVLYQINTTDIDDKIILRARQDYLVKELDEDASVDFDALAKLAGEALEEARAKAGEKTAKIERDLAGAIERKDSRARTEQEGLLDAQRVKTKNLENDAANIEAAAADASRDRSALLSAARSVAAEKLDRERGHTVTDKAIFDAHSRKYEREFMEDMDLLGIRPPDVLTRVTEYIPQIVDFVRKLVDDGHAYESNGSVYQSIDEFKRKGGCYRKLSPAGADDVDTSEADMAEGEGALAAKGEAGEKRNPNDFALWKASKSGEPAWDSPWGPGRPGWHIECSVVAGDVLGTNLDIHSGGEDLKFPHHDNELAQSEARFGCDQWVNYFTHTGHLHIEGLKMSKSLKNFITIRQALENNTARQLRIMFLMQAWDQPMNYSDQTVDDARTKEKTFRSFFREVEALCRNDYLAEEVGWRMGEADHKLGDAYLAARQSVHEKLLDNFDTKGAMGALMDVIGEANVYLRMKDCKPTSLLMRSIAIYVTQILRVFGVIDGEDDFGFGSGGGGGGGGGGAEGGGESAEAAAEPYIDTLVTFREKVRNAALDAAKKATDPADAIQAILASCDALRDEVLPPLGVRLEDRPAGTQWNREDPEAMMREIAEKKAREAELRISKLEKQLAAKRKEMDKVKDSMTKPEEFFKTEEYKEWDDKGMPTVAANGEALSKGQTKKIKKMMDKQTKAHNDLMKKSDGKPEEYMEGMKEAVEGIEAQLAKLSV